MNVKSLTTYTIAISVSGAALGAKLVLDATKTHFMIVTGAISSVDWSTTGALVWIGRAYTAITVNKGKC